MSPRHTTTYLVLTRSVGSRQLVSVPMINRSFSAPSIEVVADRARALLAADLGVQSDSFSVEVTRVDLVPGRHEAA